MDIQLILLNQIEQEIEGTFEDFELDFVIGVFQEENERVVDLGEFNLANSVAEV